MNFTRTATLTVVVVLLACACAFAAVPPMINYQGKLMQPSGAPVPDGTYEMTFAIYSVPTGGTALWSEPNPSVQVKGGLFAVLLGSIVNLPSNLFDSGDRFFGVKVGADPEMTPRQQIASVAFAQRAAVAGTVDDGAITTSKLADESVQGGKLARGAVATDRLADGSVTTPKIADAAVTSAKVKPSSFWADGGVAGDFSTTNAAWTIVPGAFTTYTTGITSERIFVYANCWVSNSGGAACRTGVALFAGGAGVVPRQTGSSAAASGHPESIPIQLVVDAPANTTITFQWGIYVTCGTGYFLMTRDEQDITWHIMGFAVAN